MKPERAAIRGHTEARDRLIDLGWTPEQIDELEDACLGYVDFARCVKDEIQHDNREITNE